MLAIIDIVIKAILIVLIAISANVITNFLYYIKKKYKIPKYISLLFFVFLVIALAMLDPFGR